MLWPRRLPWEYAARNLARRPGRSLIAACGLALVVFLVMLVVGFVRSLEASLAATGDPRTVLVHRIGAAENLESSSVPGRTGELLSASVGGIQSRRGIPYASPEIYLGTQVTLEGENAPRMAVARGVTPQATLVHERFQLLEGSWPGPNEILVGRLAATKLGATARSGSGSGALDLGKTVMLEGNAWRVSGSFAAGGSAFDSEIWCPLEELQHAMKRQDLTLVALRLQDSAALGDVEAFCKERLDLELQATPEPAYYAALSRHYAPIRAVAWLVAGLVGAAGAFAGLGTMYAAVMGRARELATLETIGFSRAAIALGLVQEGLLLAAASSLVAASLALLLLDDGTIRFTMGAFALRMDSACVLIGCGAGLGIGLVGVLPPAARVLGMPIVERLKTI